VNDSGHDEKLDTLIAEAIADCHDYLPVTATRSEVFLSIPALFKRSNAAAPEFDHKTQL
jgi:hypothetical protein